MEEGGVFIILPRRSVEEAHQTHVPSLIGFADPGQIERRQTVGRRGAGWRGTLWLSDAGNSAFVTLARMQVVLVPDEDRNLHSLVWQRERFILEKRTDNVPAQNQNKYDEFILRRRQCNP